MVSLGRLLGAVDGGQQLGEEDRRKLWAEVDLLDEHLVDLPVRLLALPRGKEVKSGQLFVRELQTTVSGGRRTISMGLYSTASSVMVSTNASAVDERKDMKVRTLRVRLRLMKK